jgi:hypothetical protein
VTSHPWATVFVDGERVGDTPLSEHVLRPGAHRVRAVHGSGLAFEEAFELAPGEHRVWRVPPAP